MSSTWKFSAPPIETAVGSSAVQVGIWNDWERPGLSTRTITLEDGDATLLVIGLTILTTVAAGRSWHIWRSLWHAYMVKKHSGPDKKVPINRMEQKLILRNSETTLGALPTMLSRLWSGRKNKKDRGYGWTDASLITFVIVHAIIFLASGFLVSKLRYGKIVKSHNLDGCGFWNVPIADGFTELEQARTRIELQVNNTITAETYVRSCYTQGGSHNLLECNKFLTSALSYTVESSDWCPFSGSNACTGGEYPAVVMTTSPVHFKEFGFNDRWAKEMKFIRKSSCAVINSTLFETGDSGGSATYSFWSKNGVAENIIVPDNAFSQRYYLTAYNQSAMSPDGSVINERLLTSVDGKADISLILLNNAGVAYERKIDDPFFSAHKISGNLYRADNKLNAIACAEQKQLCSDRTSQCTEWTGLVTPFNDADYEATLPILLGNLEGLSDEQKDMTAVQRILSIVTESASISDSVKNRGADAVLEASRHLLDGVQTRFRDDQWKFELEFWFAVSLAKIQVGIFDSIDAPLNVDQSRVKNLIPSQKPGVEPAESDKPYLKLKETCGRIKFYDPKHTSFSGNGIFILVAVAGFFTILSLVILIIQEFHTVNWYNRSLILREWYQSQMLFTLGTIAEPGSTEKTSDSVSVSESDHERRPPPKRTGTTELGLISGLTAPLHNY